MFSPELPTNPEGTPVVLPPETAATERSLSPEQARWSVETLSVLRHPAVASLSEMSRDEGHRGQAVQYMQQLTLAKMLSQGVLGTDKNLRSSKVMDEFADTPVYRVTLPLRSANHFHNCFAAYANNQQKTGPEQATDIINGQVAPNVTRAVQDMMGLYDQGLVDAEGGTANFQLVSDIMRFLNVNLLFSDQATGPDFVNKYFDMVYEKLVGEAPIATLFDKQAKQYAAQYGRPVTSAKVIKNIRRQAGNKVGDLTNRAALHLLMGGAKAELIGMLNNPESRQKYASALRAMGDSDLRALSTKLVEVVRWYERPPTAPTADTQGAKEEDAEELSESIVQAAELNWEVLPPGELEQKAREIVAAQSGSTKEITIDLERLRILDNVRQLWGADRSYYAHGRLGQRRVIKRDGQEQPDQYLLLILQELDDTGNVVQEHAVAESPIAGLNALYVFRQDVSEGLAWRDVMALPKSYARDLNARALRHVQPRSAPEDYLVTSMTQKVASLLSCQKHEFLIMEFHGERGMRIPKGAIPQPE